MPNDPRQLLQEAYRLDQNRRYPEAIQAYRTFLAIEPGHAEAWSNLAGKLLIMGDQEGARKAAQAALDLAPWHPAARINLGRALMQVGRAEEAEAHFQAVAAQDAQRMDARLFLAECRLGKRDLRGAFQALEAALPLAYLPGRSPAMLAHYAELWAILSMGLVEELRLLEAEETCATALQLDGRNITALRSLAALFMARGQREDAEPLLRRLASDHPGHREVSLQLAGCLLRGGLVDEADQLMSGLVQASPQDLDIHQAVLAWHYAFGRWQSYGEEIARFRKVVPSSPHPDYHQSFVDLLHGDFRRGWEGHEARLRIPKELRPAHRSFPQPSWDGTPFPGKTLLLWAEQGFGDTLMFLRYLPQVARRGGRVWVEVQPPLLGVAATCDGGEMVTPAQMKGQDFDLQLSLHSLPWIMGTELATIPRDVPYLRVPHPVPQEAELRQRLAESRHPFRVGVMWAGNPGHVRDSERSLPVAALTRLGHLPGVTWVNLQSRREEVPDLPDRIDVGPLLTNFSATAYVLSQVDLLITVDTAVAHLAGAMGVRTFLMVTFQPDWRWLLERRDSPWYPSLTLYRQPAYGDWDTVVRSIEEDLRRELGVGVSFQG